MTGAPIDIRRKIDRLYTRTVSRLSIFFGDEETTASALSRGLLPCVGASSTYEVLTWVAQYPLSMVVSATCYEREVFLLPNF